VFALPTLEAATMEGTAQRPDGRNVLHAATAGRIAYRRASEVQAKPICWLWKGRIARGKVSMLAGILGSGNPKPRRAWRQSSQPVASGRWTGRIACEGT